MLKRKLVVSCLAGGCLVMGLAGEVLAQGGARRFSSPYSNFGPGNINAPSPRRQLRRNSQPMLSPYLNLLPEAAGTFEGQYLLRTIPQQEQIRNQEQTRQAFQGVQNQLNQQQAEILRSGITTTGHATSFLNLGSYFGGR